MKIISFLCLALIFVSCGKNLPESFGIYVNDSHAYFPLKSQEILFNGNLLESVSGLKGSSNILFKEVNSLIIYLQDVNPEQIKLVKLTFQEGGYVRNLFGQSYTEINLWTVEKDIAIKVSPISNKNNMYEVMPIQPFDSGFYAIHFGSLTNKNTSEAFHKIAYDFVIGNSTEPYQSLQERIGKNEQAFTTNAEILLNQINDLYNKRNYNEIRKIYFNADGNMFDDSAWNSMVEGFENWSLQSGQIKSSKIVSKNIEDNNGTFSLQTEYEKIGLVNEGLNIIRKNNSYFITFIGTN